MLEITLLPELDRDVPALTEHQPVEFVCAAARGSNLALTVDGLALEPFLRPGDAAWRWRWNPGTSAGLHQLELLITDPHGNTIRQHYSLRVYTRKLDQELVPKVQYLSAALAGSTARQKRSTHCLKPGSIPSPARFAALQPAHASICAAPARRPHSGRQTSLASPL
jgi:hypothetical protein